MVLDELQKLSGYAWHGRMMFGTDLPVWQAHDDCGLTERYRAYAQAFRVMGLAKCARMAFCDFRKRSGKMDQSPQFYVVRDQCNKEKIK